MASWFFFPQYKGWHLAKPRFESTWDCCAIGDTRLPENVVGVKHDHVFSGWIWRWSPCDSVWRCQCCSFPYSRWRKENAVRGMRVHLPPCVRSWVWLDLRSFLCISNSVEIAHVWADRNGNLFQERLSAIYWKVFCECNFKSVMQTNCSCVQESFNVENMVQVCDTRGYIITGTTCRISRFVLFAEKDPRKWTEY